MGAGRFGLPPLVDLAENVRVPWLGLFGDLDHRIPVANVESLRVALQPRGPATEIVRYANAGHGFNSDDRAHFVPEAAADAWRRCTAWLDRYVGGRVRA